MTYTKPMLKVGEFIELFGWGSELIHILDTFGNQLYVGRVDGIQNQNTEHHNEIKERYVHHINLESGNKLLVYSETIIAR